MDRHISEAQTRQKRVLPSRSRRGGPGVGSCDVDVMILDMQKRKGENEPLIPAKTQFLLTTNSALVSSSSTSNLWLNSDANERYFDRPEVLKAYREQQTIQTPEFIHLSEDAIVGGRFRPRGLEDQQIMDTSDSSYEKRHRKYETFEKRQRLREKEKLKHEQYKLKERIEQLRAMDGAAFLTLSPSSFSPMPFQSNEGGEDNESSASLSEAHANGPVTLNEGERRRKEMLDIALSLEERYRTLLPPDRKGIEKDKKGGRQSSIGTSTEPEGKFIRKGGRKHHDSGESEFDPEESLAEVAKSIKLKIKFPPRTTATSKTHPTDSGARERNASLPPPLTKAPFGRRSTVPTSSPSTPQVVPLPQYDSDSASPHSPLFSPMSTVATASFPWRPTSPTAPGAVINDANGHNDSGEDSGNSITRHRKRRKSAAPDSEPSTKETNDALHLRHVASGSFQSISASLHPSTARASRHSTTKSHVSYAGAAGKVERTTSVLLISALRKSNAPKARQTQRHLTAFGTKVPSEVDEFRDFVIPEWVKEDTSKNVYDEDFTEVGGTAYPSDIPEKSDVDMNGVSKRDGIPVTPDLPALVT